MRRRSGSGLFVLVFTEMHANLIVNVMLNSVADLFSDMRFDMLRDEGINVSPNAGAGLSAATCARVARCFPYRLFVSCRLPLFRSGLLSALCVLRSLVLFRR